LSKNWQRPQNSYFAYHLDGARIYPAVADAPQFDPSAVSAMIAARLGERWIEIDGTRYLTRFTVLSDQNLMMGIRVPETVVYAGRTQYLVALAGSALTILILSSVLAYFVGRALTRRIGTTLGALDAIGAGEFGVRIPGTDGQDELSALQRRINDLADSFARRTIEREAATRWLEENEKRFRDFAESTSDAFWETDADHRHTFFSNPGRNFGHSQNSQSIIGTIRGQYFIDAGLFAGGWAEHQEDMKQHRVIRAFEFSGLHPDGTVFHRTSSAVPVFEVTGRFTGYRGTTTDITGRVETQNRLENLVSNLPGLVFQRLLYPDDRIDYSYLSTSAADWLGNTPAEEKLAAWRNQDMAHPDDRDRVRRVILDNARAGKAFAVEFRNITPDGNIGWLRAVCAAPVRRPDGVIVQDGVVFDITDLKNAQEEAQTSERRLADFATSASDTLWETDSDHRLKWMTDPEKKENRYYNTSVMIGRRRWEFPGVAPQEDPVWAPLMEALENIQLFRDFEFESRLEDGTQVYRRISGRPVFNENGDFTGYRGISTDITERVMKDREAREKQQRLIDAI
jgi:PAS domain S-box-containing protein